MREFCWRCYQWRVRDEGCRLMFHGNPCGVEVGGVGQEGAGGRLLAELIFLWQGQRGNYGVYYAS